MNIYPNIYQRFDPEIFRNYIDDKEEICNAIVLIGYVRYI
jgi:hypothetical protein